MTGKSEQRFAQWSLTPLRRIFEEFQIFPRNGIEPRNFSYESAEFLVCIFN